jgi:regulator of replication initiation timing
MNTRGSAAALALIVTLAFYITHRVAERSDAELSARIAQLEQQVGSLKQGSAGFAELKEMKAENARLVSENHRLRSRLAEVQQNVTSTDRRVARVLHAPAKRDAYDPLAFYRRNPELMKRYFPQLYQAEMKSAQKAEDRSAPRTDEE